jgi:hypothetical protein
MTMTYQSSDLASWFSAFWDDPSDLRQCHCHILQGFGLQLGWEYFYFLWR